MKISTLEGLVRYKDHGLPPGDFLTKVLLNDLVGACQKADDQNGRDLFEIVKWVYNELPGGAWGSKENMQHWINIGGLVGQRKQWEKEAANETS